MELTYYVSKNRWQYVYLHLFEKDKNKLLNRKLTFKNIIVIIGRKSTRRELGLEVINHLKELIMDDLKRQLKPTEFILN